VHDVAWRFCGREVQPNQRALIQDVVAQFPGLSRGELALTACEWLDWRRPNGRLKAREAREFLERLAQAGVLVLPDKRAGRPQGSSTSIPITPRGTAQPTVTGLVGDLGPIVIERVDGPDAQRLFRELVGRYHYLGYRVPFGAQLRYLVYAVTPPRTVVACLQFSSPAWRMASRDAWVGWDDAGRTRNLQLVVNNSRFLILPWVRVQNLASTILSRVAKRIREDWQAAYGVAPVLLETLVDPTRFDGGCYRAANWIALGQTTGRGRMDRYSQRRGAAPKRVLLYPLVKDAAARLRGR
jgi:Domain of unknown function (DUF4338)